MSQKATFINDLSLPAIAAPMFLISGPELVIECCKNGIVGTFPALNQRTSDGFEEWSAKREDPGGGDGQDPSLFPDINIVNINNCYSGSFG